ncbi:hypothetical protein K523DRAFT_381118, partial [Schizophyllum commune Tattone D]
MQTCSSPVVITLIRKTMPPRLVALMHIPSDLSDAIQSRGAGLRRERLFAHATAGTMESPTETMMSMPWYTSCKSKRLMQCLGISANNLPRRRLHQVWCSVGSGPRCSALNDLIRELD